MPRWTTSLFVSYCASYWCLAWAPPQSFQVALVFGSASLLMLKKNVFPACPTTLARQSTKKLPKKHLLIPSQEHQQLKTAGCGKPPWKQWQYPNNFQQNRHAISWFSGFSWSTGCVPSAKGRSNLEIFHSLGAAMWADHLHMVVRRWKPQAEAASSS